VFVGLGPADSHLSQPPGPTDRCKMKKRKRIPKKPSEKSSKKTIYDKDGVVITRQTLDDARLENRALDWFCPVDLLTEMPDPETGYHQRLWSYELDFLREVFGNNFTLMDIKIFLESKGLKIERFGWSGIIQLVNSKTAKNKKPKPDEIKMSLREFLEKCTDVDERVIDSKIKRIKFIDKRQSILPQTANSPRGNQTKLYYRKNLISCWSALKDAIPTLPNMKNIQG